MPFLVLVHQAAWEVIRQHKPEADSVVTLHLRRNAILKSSAVVEEGGLFLKLLSVFLGAIVGMLGILVLETVLSTALNLEIDALDSGDHAVDAHIDDASDLHPWLVVWLVAHHLHETVLMPAVRVVEKHCASDLIQNKISNTSPFRIIFKLRGFGVLGFWGFGVLLTETCY